MSQRIKNRKGFTLIELLIVLVIIGLLAGLVAPRVFKGEKKGRVTAAKAQIQLLEQALDQFRLDAGRYPSTSEGLTALQNNPGSVEGWDGPYLKKAIPSDPWGHAYVYTSPGTHGDYDLYSYGADGAEGGEGDSKDITSWE
jgi:general secretion pathway protein G